MPSLALSSLANSAFDTPINTSLQGRYQQSVQWCIFDIAKQLVCGRKEQLKNFSARFEIQDPTLWQIESRYARLPARSESHLKCKTGNVWPKNSWHRLVYLETSISFNTPQAGLTLVLSEKGRKLNSSCSAFAFPRGYGTLHDVMFCQSKCCKERL